MGEIDVPRLDAPFWPPSARNHGDALVEALVLSELFRERPTRLTQAQLASNIVYDLEEESEARAERAVEWLIEDGLLRIVDGYIRLGL